MLVARTGTEFHFFQLRLSLSICFILPIPVILCQPSHLRALDFNPGLHFVALAAGQDLKNVSILLRAAQHHRMLTFSLPLPPQELLDTVPVPYLFLGQNRSPASSVSTSSTSFPVSASSPELNLKLGVHKDAPAQNEWQRP